MNKNNEIRVAITGFGGLDNSEPGTAVARALKIGWEGKISIDALGYDPWMTGAFSPGLIDNIHILPPLSDGDHAILERIIEINEKRKFHAIIPTLELEISVLSRLEERLKSKGIKVLVPSYEHINMVTKTLLPYFCYRNKIPTPITLHVPNVNDVPFHANQFTYPIMVKGVVASAQKVDNWSDALFYARKFNSRWGGGAILQEKIEGEEFDVSIVARNNESCASILAMKKLGINQKGKGVIGSPVNDPELIKHSLKILKKLHWKGPLELEYIKSNNTNKYILLEINPRFPSWILLSHFTGINQPATLLKEILKPNYPIRNTTNMKKAFVRNIEEITLPFEKIKKLTSHKSLEVKQNNFQKKNAIRKKNNAKNLPSIAISGISTFDYVMPGLGYAKAISESNEIGNIYGLAYGPYDTGIVRTDLFNKIFLFKDMSSKKILLNRILEINRSNKIDLIIPSLDSELKSYIEIQDELKKNHIITLLPSLKAFKKSKDIIGLNNHKGEVREGFTIPKTIRSNSIESFRQVSKSIGYPFVAKGVINDFAANPVTIYNKYQLPYVWEYFDSAGFEYVISKKFFKGEEFSIAGVCDRNNNLAGNLTIKKLLTCERGNTWAARKISLPKLENEFKKILKEINWIGPIEFEFIRDSFDEEFKLIEINCRFPAWISYAKDVGYNLPKICTDLALSKKINDFYNDKDLIFMRNCLEIDTDMIKFGKFLKQQSL